MKKHLPNFITSLNLAAGFIAVLLAAEGRLAAASWIILAAMIFDFLDGLSARLLKAYSEIGRELDSLADMVSFGVAPALIVYKLLSASQGAPLQLFGGGKATAADLILLIPVIMPVCAGLRLAKFNTDSTQATSFKGLPTPANALAVISVLIAQQYSGGSFIDQFTSSSAALILFTIIISLLMVIRIPMLSLKTKNLRFRGNEARYILAASVVTALALLGLTGIILIIPLYIAASLLVPLFRQD